MPYLTVAEYIARFGNRETIALTQEEPGVNVVDEPKVEAAILDAVELAEGYAALRYTVPIASPPGVLVGMIADLARERLHRNRPTPEVTAAADRARSQLKDIAAGRLTLLLDEVGEAEMVGDNMSETSGDAPTETFSRDALDSFTTLGRGPFYESRWKQ